MTQKAAAVGNWWLAASSWRHTRPCIMSRAEFFWWNIKSPRWLSPPAAHIWCPETSGIFPKLKSPLKKREEISDPWWDSGKYHSAADGYWENCVRSQGAYFEGDWGAIVLCTMFLVSSSISVSIFQITRLDTFWTDLMSSLSEEDSCLFLSKMEPRSNSRNASRRVHGKILTVLIQYEGVTESKESETMGHL